MLDSYFRIQVTRILHWNNCLTKILSPFLLFNTEVFPLVNRRRKDEQTSNIMNTSSWRTKLLSCRSVSLSFLCISLQFSLSLLFLILPHVTFCFFFFRSPPLYSPFISVAVFPLFRCVYLVFILFAFPSLSFFQSFTFKVSALQGMIGERTVCISKSHM